MKQMKSCFRDYVFFTVMLGVCVAVFFINKYGVTM